MTSSFMSNELNKGLTNVPQIKCLPLQEYRQLRLDLDQSRRETASLRQKLCYARRNLEEEKRKRRVIEHHKNILETQRNMAREVLFHDEEANLNEDIKEKLQFLNKPEIDVKYNNLNVQDKRGDRHLTRIVETDSTGSILSDLNCLSKSEDDLDTDIIVKAQREKKWKEYKPNGECCTMNKQGSTLDKRANVKLHQVAKTTKEYIDSKLSNAEASSANHSFMSKIVIKPETCTPCGKRIRFGKIALKCRACPATCHPECRIQIISVPCGCGKSQQRYSTGSYFR
ncbi:rac GTPase-activating protein 1-like isoform X2 [Temnothorax curvispinosus]|uniref:Rac GTPase-activating protein 1-like isoform X2 n=1 Tax=Temnothorax curvispinosus TaxID=300111 RepID=A0A6J1QZ33_9HYME|nr:rac GTPase-activating protein 1-like isoform X2 [Temnothorax curvispinosus]